MQANGSDSEKERNKYRFTTFNLLSMPENWHDFTVESKYQ